MENGMVTGDLLCAVVPVAGVTINTSGDKSLSQLTTSTALGLLPGSSQQLSNSFHCFFSISVKLEGCVAGFVPLMTAARTCILFFRFA
jgi:hypothetical protein